MLLLIINLLCITHLKYFKDTFYLRNFIQTLLWYTFNLIYDVSSRGSLETKDWQHASWADSINCLYGLFYIEQTECGIKFQINEYKQYKLTKLPMENIAAI